jgi:hypothetical protein
LYAIYLSVEEFEDVKGVIRIGKSKNDRQHSGQKKKDKQRSTNITHKTKDRVKHTTLKTGDELSSESIARCKHHMQEKLVYCCTCLENL